MLKWIYLINALISVFCLLYYFEIIASKVNTKQLFVLIFIAASNYSYAMSVFADNMEGLFVALQFYYTTNIFIAIVFLMVIAELCGYQVPRWLRITLLAVGIFILAVYSQIKESKLYYTSYVFVKKYGISTMTRTYGPVHFVLYLFLFAIDFLSIYYVFRSWKEKKDVSEHTIGDLISLLLVTSVLFIVPKIFKINIEVIPFIFTLIDFVLIKLFRRAALYDISSNLLNVFERRKEYGYIAIDTKYRYLSSNNFAKEIFPNLVNIRIDSRIERAGTLLSGNLISWMERWINGERSELALTSDNKTVRCSINEIQNGKKVIGYLIELRDDTNNQRYIELINNYNGTLQNEVQEKTQRIQDIQESIITGMATMVESRDNSTGGHIKRTSAGVKVFIERLKSENAYSELTPEFCERVIKAAPMHDLGKIAVDDAVLRKPGKFTPEEFEQMKKHPGEGARIVEQVLQNVDDDLFKKIAINVAHFHHERWDGSGYPTGIKGEEIPLEARIMSFADVFDALVSKRCYKDSFSYNDAFETIERNLGTQFDPELGKYFLECKSALISLYESLEE